MKLKLFVAASLVALASQAVAPAWAKAIDPTGPTTNTVIAGTINPFCLALQIKGVRTCKP